MVLIMERRIEEIEKRLSRLEVKVDDIEKTLYIVISAVITQAIRILDPHPASQSIGFAVVFLTLAGLALYKLTLSNRKRRQE